MLGIGKLWGEFKAFAFQGNMIELAVAVVIGGAFGTVIHSLVGDIIMPTVAYAIHTSEQAAEKAKEVAQSGLSKAGIATSQPTTAPTTQTTVAAAATPPAAAAAPAPAAAATPDQPVKIDLMLGPVPVGKFLTELINFIILAFAVFIMIVKLLGGVMKKMKGPEVPGEPTTKECLRVLVDHSDQGQALLALHGGDCAGGGLKIPLHENTPRRSRWALCWRGSRTVTNYRASTEPGGSAAGFALLFKATHRPHKPS